MNKKIVCTLVCIIVAVILIGVMTNMFSKKKENRATIYATVGPEPSTIDPQKGTAIDERSYVRHMFEGLTRVDTQGNTVPGMAEKWEVDETNTKYVFHIRDAKWSDGKAVTANDFEFAWKRLLNPETASQGSTKLYILKNAEKYNKGECSSDEVGVKAIDDKTLEVTLESPAAYFVSMLGYECFVPTREDIVDNDGKWIQSADTYISNGAYKLKEWVHGSKIVMEKNENYWDADSVKTQNLEFLLIDDYSAGLNAFEAGELDINDAAYPTDEVNRLIENGSLKVSPYLSTYFYLFNTKQKPLDNVKVRKAISLAVDRSYIVHTVTGAGEVEATAYVPKGINGISSDFREESDLDILSNDPKIEEAKKLLSEAGYENGEGLPTIEILFNTSDEHQKIAEAVQHDLKENLGINVSLRNIEWSALLDTFRSGDYQMGRYGSIADYDDPITFLERFTTNGSANYTGWSSNEYDELINTARLSADANVRMQAMHKAESMLIDESIICPIYWYVQKVLINDNLKDAYVSPFGGYYLTHAYIEE